MNIDNPTALLATIVVLIAGACGNGVAIAQQPASFSCSGDDPVEGVLWDIVADNNNRVYVAGRGGIYRSCDGGDSWTEPAYVTEAALTVMIDPLDNAIVYYATSSGKVYRSTDYAASFILTGNREMMTSIFALAARSDGTILAGTRDGIYQSIDRGDHWNLLPGSPSGNDFHAMLVDPGNDNVIYAAAYGDGVYRTVDGGISWSRSDNGAADWYVNEMQFAPQNPSMLFAMASRGLWQSVDSGVTWVNINALRGSDFAIPAGHPMDAYLVSRFDGVHRSQDGGQTWSGINAGFPAPLPALQSLHVLPDGRVLAGTGSEGLFKTDNNGITWDLAGPPVVGSPPPPTGSNPPPAYAALSVEIRNLRKEAVPAGSNAKFRVTITNNGPDMSTDTVASFAWFHQPIIGSVVGHTYTMDPTQGHCAHSVTSAPDCVLGNLARDESVVIEFRGSTTKKQLHWYEIRVWAGNAQTQYTLLGEQGTGTSVTVLSTDGGGGAVGWLMILVLAVIATLRRKAFMNNLIGLKDRKQIVIICDLKR